MRGFTSAIIQALQNETTRTAVLVRLDFASAPVLAHNRLGQIIHNSETYLGLGSLGSISVVGEGSELKPYNLTLGITGFDPSLVSTALNDDYQGRAADIFIGLLNADQTFVDGAPFLQIAYRMDTIDGRVGPTSASLSVNLQTRLADWNRPKPGRYTDQYQQAEFPGDLGLEFITEMVDKSINWGVPTDSGLSGGGGRRDTHSPTQDR